MPLRLAAWLLAIALLVAPRSAFAWVDVYVDADDIRITAERGGKARIEHKITMRIAGGPLRAFDIRGVDDDAVLDSDAYVVTLKEAQRGSLTSAVPVSPELLAPDSKPRADGSPAPRVLRVKFQGRGLTRGAYVLSLRYATDLASRITGDGSAARLRWTGPIWDYGFDSARVTFDLPSAPNEPRPEDAPAAASEEGEAAAQPLVLSTVRRHPNRDEIELLKPYAPKGEAVVWAIRADARALLVRAEPPRPKAKAPLVQLSDSLGSPDHRTFLLGAGASVFLIYALLVALKGLEVGRHTRAARTSPRPLVPLPLPLRAIGAGLFLLAGLWFELASSRITLGAVLVVAACAFAAHRTPLSPKEGKLRRPGRWYPASEAQAFRAPPKRTALLDASTRAGKLLFIVCLLALAGLVVVLWENHPFKATVLAFDAVVVLALFGTGRISELPPDPAVFPAPMLGAVARRMRRILGDESPRFVGKIRIPDGALDPDELRMAIVPKSPLPGFSSLEIGVVYAQGAGGAVAFPQVLLRAVAGSRCEEALAHLARHARVSRGRKPNERVLAFSPRLPTVRMTASIAAALTRMVTNHGAPAAKTAIKKAA